MVLKHHALHHICILTMFHAFRCVFTLLQYCVLVGLDWAKPIMYLSLHVTCSCIFMHTYLQFLYILIYYCCWYFSNCLSLFLALVYSIAPKHKSTPSQNPLCSRASSSSNPTPSFVRFRDDKARKDFSENFCRRGIHLEHHVVLSDFSDTDLPTVIHSRG